MDNSIKKHLPDSSHTFVKVEVTHLMSTTYYIISERY